jgi:hypothetical protein
MKTLNRRERLILDTLLPGGADPGLPYGLFDDRSEAFWLEFKRSSAPTWRLGLRLALFVTTWVAPLLILRPPPLTLYSRSTRERALRAMGSSRFYLLRQTLQLLKTIASLCYGADPRVRQAVGYPVLPGDTSYRLPP